MRKLIILSLAVSLFAACNNDKGKVSRDDRRSDRESDDYRNRDEEDNTRDDRRDYSAKWASGDVSRFNRECEQMMEDKGLTNDQMTEICSCLLGKFQDKYSSYSDLDKNSTEEEGEAAGRECMKGITKTTADDNSGGWTRSDQQQWMDVCETSVGSSMGKEKKYEYCWCVMEKLEKRYENYDKMNRQGTEQEGIDLGKECLRKMGLQ
ncbi:MAG: hypothetical protein ACT4OJ_11915 [Bacteroidota bacterium]